MKSWFFRTLILDKRRQQQQLQQQQQQSHLLRLILKKQPLLKTPKELKPQQQQQNIKNHHRNCSIIYNNGNNAFKNNKTSNNNNNNKNNRNHLLFNNNNFINYLKQNSFYKYNYNIKTTKKELYKISTIMGSINCKEYTTNVENSNNSCAKQAEDAGPTGTYQAKGEADCATTTTNTTTTTTTTAIIETMTEVKPPLVTPNPVFTEPVKVCHESDLKENELQAFQFDEDNKVLIVKQNGVVRAVGNKCTHYGAPLNTGALGDGRVRCPWHGACFDLTTGDIEDFPGLDSLPCYKVCIRSNGGVYLQGKLKDLENNKHLKDMVRRKDDDERCFVIIGGGPSGGVCAEALRQEGFHGRIVMLCREPYLPYDRVKLSKSLSIDMDTIQFRKQEFYDTYDIETMLNVEAKFVNTPARLVECSNGYSIKYDKLFIATGAHPIKPCLPGSDLENVVTLREHMDANNIDKAHTPDSHVVCLGASFIALETAAYFAKKAKSVSVVGRENVPLKAAFGEQVGERMLKLFEDNGVKMIMNSGIKEIIGDETGKVKEVVLADDSKIPCDLLVMGTGGRPNTEFLQGSGIERNQNGSIDTDMHLMTNVPNVYVGGDVANAPVFSISNQRATIGHYQLAQYHGRVAAKNMAERETKELRAVPFFFTMIFGKGIRYSGYGKFKDVVIEGSLADLKFVAYYLNEEDQVIAVASCGRDPIVAQFAELQFQGKALTRKDLDNPDEPTAWTKMLQIGWDKCTRAC